MLGRSHQAEPPESQGVSYALFGELRSRLSRQDPGARSPVEHGLGIDANPLTITCIACDSLAPRYSIAAQMTPPVRDETQNDQHPRSWNMRSAPGVNGMSAPCIGSGGCRMAV